MNNKIEITREGYNEIKSEIKRRKLIERTRIANDIERARQQGDLSENASYKGAMEEKEYNENEIVNLEKVLNDSKIVISNTEGYSKVNLGATVTIRDLKTKEIRIYRIVGENESNIFENKLSLNSPIARAMINKKINDVIEYKTNTSLISFEILKIK